MESIHYAKSTCLLVLEDDLALLGRLVALFADEGYESHGFNRVGELLAALESRRPDLLILDIILPDGDGREVCTQLRLRGLRIPVLFLTARATRDEKLAGFAAGCDDYVTKPFDLDELLCRVAVLTRRRLPEASSPELELDEESRRLSCGQATAVLSPTETRLLAALIKAAGEVVSRDVLLEAAWGRGAVAPANSLEVYVSRLRNKLATLPHAPTLVTVRFVGYRLK